MPSDDSGTSSSTDFSDSTINNSNKSSSKSSSKGNDSSSSNDGTTSQTANDTSSGSVKNTNNSGSSTSSTGTTTNTGSNTGVTTGAITSDRTLGSTLDSAFANSNDSSDASTNSSSNSLSRIVSDSLSMGTTAATFITSGGAMSEGMATGVSLAGFNFTTFIKALQDQGQTSILSNPKVSVLNGQPALISVGKHVTYIKKVSSTQTEGGGVSYSVDTDQILSGIGLSLSAVVKDNNEIVMHLVPITSELSGPIEYKDFGALTVGLPIVDKREMNTTVKIKDGSMLVVGGLISEVDAKSGEYLPGAKDVPYLKYLFGYEEKQKSKRELIILLRPRIIN
ncbi:hypothetical protein VU07_02710 [Desulfobulbus sp. F4]|nr:hypothetical protein [Desulfobulbus sp. F4]